MMDGFRDKARKAVEREREREMLKDTPVGDAGLHSQIHFTAGVPLSKGPGSDTFS